MGLVILVINWLVTGMCDGVGDELDECFDDNLTARLLA